MVGVGRLMCKKWPRWLKGHRLAFSVTPDLLLPRTGWKLFHNIASEKIIKMSSGARSFIDPVGTVWISHHLKRLVGRDQRINQLLRSLVVNVVVACTVNDQKLSF